VTAIHPSPYQAAEKRPSAAFPSSFVVAAYIQVRLIPQDIREPCIWAFLSSLRKITFSATAIKRLKILYPSIQKRRVNF
jgi:hypothetical protein